MASFFGARAPARTTIPFTATYNAIQSGVLPTLNQEAAPTGYDLAYDLSSFGATPTLADANAKLQELGGLNVAIVREPEPEKPWWQTALAVAGTLASFWTVAGGAKLVLSEASRPELIDPLVGDRVGYVPATFNAGGTMSFADGDSSGGFFDNLFGGFNQALQGGLGGTLLNLGTQAAQGFISQQFAPQPVGMTQTMAAVPAVIGAGRAVATVGRGFFNRFPNLATAIQSLRNRGANISRSSLYSAMRRFDPEMLVSGGILTEAAVSELAIAGPGRRRMNPGNVKALRRAHRRMKSFHHLCTDNDLLYKRARRK